jgi:hypothetical protein
MIAELIHRLHFDFKISTGVLGPRDAGCGAFCVLAQGFLLRLALIFFGALRSRSLNLEGLVNKPNAMQIIDFHKSL